MVSYRKINTYFCFFAWVSFITCIPMWCCRFFLDARSQNIRRPHHCLIMQILWRTPIGFTYNNSLFFRSLDVEGVKYVWILWNEDAYMQKISSIASTFVIVS